MMTVGVAIGRLADVSLKTTRVPCSSRHVDRFGQVFACTRRAGHLGDHFCTGRPWHRNNGSRTYWKGD